MPVARKSTRGLPITDSNYADYPTLQNEDQPMKYLLLTLSLLSLFGCQDPETNAGYNAGYDLTCGFSSSPGSNLVVEKEFAYNFLAGARACAHKHPERARKVLGLASQERPVSPREADKQTEAVALEQRAQQEMPAPAPVRITTAAAPIKTAKAPAKAKASTKKPPARTKAPVRTKTPTRAKPPVKTKTTTKAKTPAEVKAPVQAKAPPKAKAPVQDRLPVKAAKAPAQDTRPRAAAQPRKKIQPKQSASSYELFMGQ